jgi:hypothetical protein
MQGSDDSRRMWVLAAIFLIALIVAYALTRSQDNIDEATDSRARMLEQFADPAELEQAHIDPEQIERAIEGEP